MPRAVKQSPGRVRDAIVKVLAEAGVPLSVSQIEAGVRERIGATPASSIRSYLRLNTPEFFIRENRGVYRARNSLPNPRQKYFAHLDERETSFRFRKSELHHDDCFSWMERRAPNSVQAVVTDPPYGLHEYTEEQQRKLRAGKGGVWRIPPSFDGHRRSPQSPN